MTAQRFIIKGLFETRNNYPNAYTTVVRYRTWLINENYSLLRTLNPDVSFTDAKLFLYMIEGAIIQRLSSDEVDERMVEVFLRGRCKVKMTHRLEDYPQLIRFSCGNQ